jgi:hypothetical protein
MSDPRAILADRIDRSLNLLSAAPQMWGSSESLELQALLLLEMRAVVTRPSVMRGRPSGLRGAYADYVRQVSDYAPGVLLSSALGPDRASELPSLIRSFADTFDQWLPMDTHESSDVVLQLEGAPGTSDIPFALVCKYYEHFQQGLHELTRLVGKEKKADSGMADRATLYPMPEIDVIPRRGDSPTVVIHLTQPRDGDEPDMYDGTRELERNVARAIGKASRVIEWSRSGDPVESTRSLFSNKRERMDVAFHSMKLLPRAGIASVRIGGRLMGTSGMVEMKPNQAVQIMSILEDDQEPTSFSQAGEVRALDLDQSWFRIRYDSHTSKCWVKGQKDILDVASDALATRKRILVNGRRFARRRSHFVMADRASLV